MTFVNSVSVDNLRRGARWAGGRWDWPWRHSRRRRHCLSSGCPGPGSDPVASPLSACLHYKSIQLEAAFFAHFSRLKDVISRPQVVGVQVSAQSHRHFRLVCSVKVQWEAVFLCIFRDNFLTAEYYNTHPPPPFLPHPPTESSTNQIWMMAKYKLIK